MELHGERLIPADVETTWAALNDPETLKACIAGCESLERTGDNAFTARVAVKVGPVSARFTGNLQLQNVQPPQSYTIVFDGQGGVAGFGRGSADVNLTEETPAQTKLAYEAKAQVGGKLAQIGSRLVDAAAAKIADDFFRAFEAHLQAQSAPVAADAASAPAFAPKPFEPPAGASAELPSGATDEVPSAAWAVSSMPAGASGEPAVASVPLGEPAPAEGAPMATTASTRWGWWVVAVVIAIVLLYFLAR
ncbi:MAG TPA: carbon monoxide dehydrogenase subunit G [Caldimonas sp.]|nr:carbon monoxide dehydrogenase subunit G [Caldimonas sp.]